MEENPFILAQSFARIKMDSHRMPRTSTPAIQSLNYLCVVTSEHVLEITVIDQVQYSEAQGVVFFINAIKVESRWACQNTTPITD